MNPYFLLVPVFLFCLMGAGLSYSDDARRHWSYTPWMIVLGAVCAGLFAWGAQLLDNKGKVFVFSIWYDSLVLACYYILPILIFGTRVSWGVMLGAAFVVAGLVIVKASE